MVDYLSDYTWLVRIYVAYNKKFKKANVDELKVESLSKKTVRLIQETIDAKEIDDAYPTVSVDEEYIKVLNLPGKESHPVLLDVDQQVIEILPVVSEKCGEDKGDGCCHSLLRLLLICFILIRANTRLPACEQ